MREVRLTDSEAALAAGVGIQREMEARRANRRNRFEYGGEPFAWGKHIVGALAECAFAKAMGLYWCAGVNTFRGVGDVARYEVRWSQPRTTRSGVVPPRLKVRPDENPDTIVVLVTGQHPVFTVQGWIRAGDGKRQEWLASPVEGQPAYFVPVEKLAPLDELPGNKPQGGAR